MKQEKEEWDELLRKPCVHRTELPFSFGYVPVVLNMAEMQECRSFGIAYPNPHIDLLVDNYNTVRETREWFGSDPRRLYITRKFDREPMMASLRSYEAALGSLFDPMRWFDPISSVVWVEKIIGTHFFLSNNGYICRTNLYDLVYDEFERRFSQPAPWERVAIMRRELIIL
jgi:hypothetical protein